MALAYLKGSALVWDYSGEEDILLIKDNYNMRITSLETFKYLFVEVDERRAALKEDCINYTVFDPLKPLCEYPDWYIQAYDDGFIFEDVAEYYVTENAEIVEEDISFIIYSEKADRMLQPGDIVMCNFKGEVMGLDPVTFERLYSKVDN